MTWLNYWLNTITWTLLYISILWVCESMSHMRDICHMSCYSDYSWPWLLLLHMQWQSQEGCCQGAITGKDAVVFIKPPQRTVCTCAVSSNSHCNFAKTYRFPSVRFASRADIPKYQILFTTSGFKRQHERKPAESLQHTSAAHLQDWPMRFEPQARRLTLIDNW